MSRIYEKSISEISSQQPHIQQQQQPTLYQQQQSMLSNATTLTLGNSSLFNNNNNAMANANNFIGGFSSFDSDSLPDYSEFDSESVTLDYFKERQWVHYGNSGQTCLCNWREIFQILKKTPALHLALSCRKSGANAGTDIRTVEL
uniref:Uncharacterized protein n=1 Tax=Glossina palpalis gambiensis TaxID=67801 RepID=A0A1B0BNM3_9MUSC